MESVTQVGIRIPRYEPVRSVPATIDYRSYSAAMKETLLTPAERKKPETAFEARFEKEFEFAKSKLKGKLEDKDGAGWKQVLDAGMILSAKGACEELGVTPEDLNKMWSESKLSGELIDFGGGGFCCAKVGMQGQGYSPTERPPPPKLVTARRQLAPGSVRRRARPLRYFRKRQGASAPKLLEQSIMGPRRPAGSGF